MVANQKCEPQCEPAIDTRPNAYQPCVLNCVLPMRILRNCCAVNRRAIAGAGASTSSHDITLSAVTPAITRLQRVNMLREIMPGASRTPGARWACAKHCAKAGQPPLDASLPCSCFANWASCGSDQHQLITDRGLRPGYPSWISTHPWIPVWRPAVFGQKRTSAGSNERPHFLIL